MMNQIDREEGIAYGWFVICIMVIFGAFIYLVFTQPVNSLVDVTNDQIAQGHITQQTSNAFQFNLGIFQAIPIILLVGLLFYGVLRAIYKRREEVY